MDRQNVLSKVQEIFDGADERCWSKVHKAMAPMVLLDYSSMDGGQPQELSPEAITNAWASLLPGFDRTHHQLFDFRESLNGDSVSIHCKGKADHYLFEDTWTVEGTYEIQVTGVLEKMEVTKLKFNLERQSGNINLPVLAKQIVSERQTHPSKERVELNSDGLTLVGNLYKPDGYDPAKKYPAILVGGSWTTVKEQMSGLYAQELAKHGFITLAIDPRNFGESQGEPRFFENPEYKIADYKNAISYLLDVPGVDEQRLYVTAVCASAGYLAIVAAEDSRVKGFSTVAGWLHDRESVKPFYGGDEGVEKRIRSAQEAKKRYAQTGEVEYVPTISSTDSSAAMFGEWDYYLNPKRGHVPQWSADKFATMSWEGWLNFNPLPYAKQITVPTLMVHSDGAVFPDNVKRFFANIPVQHKVLHWTEGGQLDFYDLPAQVNESVNAVTIFFRNL